MDYKTIVMPMTLLYMYWWGLILDFTKTTKDWDLPLPSSPHLPVDSFPQVSPFLVPLIPSPPPRCLPATSLNLGISFLDPHSIGPMVCPSPACESVTRRLFGFQGPAGERIKVTLVLDPNMQNFRDPSDTPATWRTWPLQSPCSHKFLNVFFPANYWRGLVLTFLP